MGKVFESIGRIVFMFCAFEGRPRILRLHASGQAFEPGEPEFERLRPEFPELPGVRAIVRAEVRRIADSCGWGVPRYSFEGQRNQLVRYAAELGPEKLRKAQLEWNRRSLDDLPGLRVPAAAKPPPPDSARLRLAARALRALAARLPRSKSTRSA